jgi:hypothetical protein
LLERSMSKLPKPNAVVALNDEKPHQMTAAHVRGIICNPTCKKREVNNKSPRAPRFCF